MPRDQERQQVDPTAGLDPVEVLNEPAGQRVIDVVVAMRQLDQADTAIFELFDEQSGHRIGTVIVATNDESAAIAKKAFGVDAS